MPPVSQSIPFARPQITDNEIEAVTAVMRSGWLTTGERTVALEKELADYVAAEHVVVVSSGTAGLEIGLAYLDLEPGAKVAVPDWTFVSTALAAHRNGGQPVLIDVDKETLNMDPESLVAALQKGLDAVVVVHFGGIPVDERIYELCGEFNVPVLEDAAHALGAHDSRGSIAGRATLGAVYSFYVTKNLVSAEGGAIATENEEFAAFARSFRLHGMSVDAWKRYVPGASADYDITVPGIKANLPDVLSAIALAQLKRFDVMQKRRRELTLRYRELLDDIGAVSVVPAHMVEGSADHLMVVRIEDDLDRQQVIAAMGAAGIGTSVHFRPLHQFSWFKDNAVIGSGGVANAESMSAHVLSLPLYPDLSNEDVERVCDVLGRAVS